MSLSLKTPILCLAQQRIGGKEEVVKKAIVIALKKGDRGGRDAKRNRGGERGSRGGDCGRMENNRDDA